MAKENTERFLFKGVKIDDRTRDYIEKKISSIVKLLDKFLMVEVEIDLDKKGKFRVEVMVRTPYELFRSESTTISVEGSIDVVEDELKRQIKKFKDKRKTLIKRGGASIKKRTTIDENARF